MHSQGKSRPIFGFEAILVYLELFKTPRTIQRNSLVCMGRGGVAFIPSRGASVYMCMCRPAQVDESLLSSLAGQPLSELQLK